MKFKNSLTVHGSKALLKAFLEEIHSLGYTQISGSNFKIDDLSTPILYLNQFVTENGTYGVWMLRGTANVDVVPEQIYLPQDWNKALLLASEKVESKHEFKIGTWVRFKDSNMIGEIIGYCPMFPSCYQLDIDGDLTRNSVNEARLTPVTEEEVALYLAKPLIEDGWVTGASVQYNDGTIYKIVEFPTSKYKKSGVKGGGSYFYTTTEGKTSNNLKILVSWNEDDDSSGFSKSGCFELVKEGATVTPIINGYKAEYSKDGQKVSFGCQTFNRDQVRYIRQSVESGKITLAFLDNVLAGFDTNISK